MRWVQTYSTPPYIQRLMDEAVARVPENVRKGVPPGVERPPSRQRIIAAFLLLHRIPQKKVAEIVTKTTGKTVTYSLLRNWQSEKGFVSLARRIAEEVGDFLFSEWERCREHPHSIHQIGYSLAQLQDPIGFLVVDRVLDVGGPEAAKLILFASWYFSRGPTDAEKLMRKIKGFPSISEAVSKIYENAYERFREAENGKNWDMAEDAFEQVAVLASPFVDAYRRLHDRNGKH